MFQYLSSPPTVLRHLNQIVLPFMESQYVLFALCPTSIPTSCLPPLSLAICLSSIACNRLLLSLSNRPHSTAPVDPAQRTSEHQLQTFSNGRPIEEHSGNR